MKCQEPVDATECPDNSVYLSGAGQFGCCGACVIFKSKYNFVDSYIRPVSARLLLHVMKFPTPPTLQFAELHILCF